MALLSDLKIEGDSLGEFLDNPSLAPERQLLTAPSRIPERTRDLKHLGLLD